MITMKKQSGFGIVLVGLSLATLISPLAISQAQAFGQKVYSKRPIDGYVCNRGRNEKLYTCYSSPVGSQGINFTAGNRKYSF
jgi:hypothetical protein